MMMMMWTQFNLKCGNPQQSPTFAFDLETNKLLSGIVLPCMTMIMISGHWIYIVWSPIFGHLKMAKMLAFLAFIHMNTKYIQWPDRYDNLTIWQCDKFWSYSGQEMVSKAYVTNLQPHIVFNQFSWLPASKSEEKNSGA